MCSHAIPSALTIYGAILASLALAAGPAAADPVVHKCGKPVSSIVKTDVSTFSTSSTSFVTVPGTTTTVDVGEGGGCIKVTFSAQLGCTGPANPDFCLLIAEEQGATVLDPSINGVTFLGESAGFSTHSFQWVKEFDPGKHKIRIRAGVQDNATVMQVLVWTLDIEVTQ